MNYWFRRWRLEGLWQRILVALRTATRQKKGRDPEASAAIVGSQSVRIAEKSGSNQGYDAAERVSGRKRNLLADTSGLLLAQRVPTVNICGNRIARELLAAHLSSCPRGGLRTPSFTFSGAAAHGGCCCKNTHLATSEKTMR